jgi:DNA polymerase (family 10)
MKIKLPYSQAKNLADRIVEELRPGCVRIAVAGSVRRERETVGDIEIVAIPRFQVDLFKEDLENEPTELDLILERLVTQGRLSKPVKNGTKYKQFGIPAVDGLMLDLFLPRLDNWGIIYAIRTGSADFSKKLVTQQCKGGLLPDGYLVNGGMLWHQGRAIPTPTEQGVFDLLDSGWIPPKERT